MAATRVDLIRPDWPAPERIRAASTTRVGGFSEGPYASLNLGAQVGDDPRTVERNRMVTGHALGTTATPSWLDQVHGADIVAADSVATPVAADASITSEVDVICAILTADCLPVLFTDRGGQHVAAAHGGWRGLVAGVLETTVSAFGARGVQADELIAWLGPAIGPAAYEVDAAVVERLSSDDRLALTRSDPAHWQLDLYALARRRLAASGVDAVFGGGFCTFAEPDRFFSCRRDRICGRQATMIWRE